MKTTIIDGKKVSQEIREELKPRIQSLTQQGLKPGLAVILVGDDPASQVYVRNKEKACEKLGIYSLKHQLPSTTGQTELLHLIDELNSNPAIHGILVQLPLPKHLDEKRILYHINTLKDVDGFHPYNLGRLMIGDPIFLPCTPWGVQELLSRYQIDISRKHVVIVGRSNIVGKPLAMMLVQKAKAANATVTICHTGTENLAQHTRMADILIAAAGSPKMITGELIREGAVVIDVGINKVESQLVGDVDFESVTDRASFVTPVPGGVGPMTIAMLMANTVKSAERTLQK